jgi:guanylate kinase
VPKRDRIVVISGPSGVGKSSIVKRLIADRRLVKSVSMTTRKKRGDEVDGKDYYFVTREEFCKALRKGQILESTELLGQMYGTPKRSVEDAMAQGKVILMEIDASGLKSLRGLGYNPFSIFIMPPELGALSERLRARASEDEQELSERAKMAPEELEQKGLYDVHIVNDELDKTVQQIKRILVDEGILIDEG